jgi:membrane protein
VQKSLNRIWEVEAKAEKSGIWTFIRIRLFSFGLILSIGFLLLISLVLSALLAAAGGWIKIHMDEACLWIFNVLNFITSMGIITLLFAMMYKFLPDAKIKWRLVWVGAFFTAILFTLGKTLLGLYFESEKRTLQRLMVAFLDEVASTYQLTKVPFAQTAEYKTAPPAAV